MVDSVKLVPTTMFSARALPRVRPSRSRQRNASCLPVEAEDWKIMKNVLFGLILMLAFGGFVTANAQTTQQVAVRVKTQKSVMRDRLRIRFVAVEDSRCPADTNCIWAGNAKVTIRVTNRNGRVETFDLNTNLEGKSVRFGGYEITLGEVTPYPRSNIRINPNGYTARFIVKKL